MSIDYRVYPIYSTKYTKWLEGFHRYELLSFILRREQVFHNDVRTYHYFFRPHFNSSGRGNASVLLTVLFMPYKTCFFFEFRKCYVIQYGFILFKMHFVSKIKRYLRTENMSDSTSYVSSGPHLLFVRTSPTFRPDRALFCWFLILLLNCNL